MKEINISSRQTRHSLAIKPKKRNKRKFLFLLLLVVFLAAVWYFSTLLNPAVKKHTAQTNSNSTGSSPSISLSKPVTVSSVCSDNTIEQNIVVSIDQRHLWACANNKQVYNTAVITGYTGIPGDVTPIGAYKIFAKQTDRYLNGTDGVTSWHDYVYYWMPFLNNEYGTYGLHDATWRASTDFGNISPSSSQASHGCVELPLPAATWLFNWATIGTTVTIQA
jgi:lipoprotein-anchoring transpeptidase ErfK/SrfK